MKKTLVFLLLIALIACEKSVVLTRGTQTNEKTIGTCVKFTSDKESCLECVPHYHLFEGQCYIDIHGCNNYVFGNICRKCQAGFILVNNECCDKHCMSKIFKNYAQAAEQSELSEEQKVERRITEGYEKTVESLTIFRYQFSKFVLVSTSNQVLQGYVRYIIKILANEKPFRCIADFESDTKKVFVLEFRPESEMSSIKQVVLSQQDVVSNQQARVALQYASGKFGLKTYGSSLERVSATSYKFASEYKLIYIGSDLVNIIHVVVATGNKKQSPYSPWSQERKDVKAVKDFVQRSMSVIKVGKTVDLEIIKQKISETSNIKKTEVEIKSIEKVKQNTYKYTFVNEQTKQVFEQVTKIDPKTKKVEIIEHKEVISVDVKNIKLPESPEKKIITKDQITQTVEIKQTIKYLEEVQPSLATKEIINAAVETIGENKKVTLIQKKNDQSSRVVVIINERTGEKKLVDESPIITTPPTQTTYTTTTEGKTKITTTDIEKFKKNDEQVDKVISKIEQKFTKINTTNIVSLEKIQGNLVNTYQVVIKSEKPEQPQQQITVIQNTQTKQVKVIDVEQIQRPAIIAPTPKKPTSLPQIQFKSTQIKMIVEQYKKTASQIRSTEQVVIKKVDVQESKFANQYTVTVQTKTGQTMTIKANKQHDEKVVEITSVKSVVSKNEQTKVVESSYVSKVTVDQITGVKTVTTTKPEQIKTSFVTQVLSEIKTTKQEVKVQQIQSVVRQEYEKTIKQTVVIKEQEKFVQVTVEKNKETGVVKKISEQVVQIKVEQSKPILPVISTTSISETTFNQVVKVNQDLKKVTETVIESKPVYKTQAPITTEIQQQSHNVQVVTMVFENKVTQEKERIVTEINQQTKKTVIKEQTILPKVIEKVTFEKDITKEGEVVLISNKIEQIKKEDKHITTVVQEVSEKIPIIKENTVRYEVVSNDITNTYQITAVEPTTKETVTVSVSYNKETHKVTVNDIQQEKKTEVIMIKPQPKPVVILTPEDIQKPQVQNVVHFVEKTVKVQQIKDIKETKSTLSTSYEVVTQTKQGIKTITVVVDNNNTTDVTLIDVVSQIKKTDQVTQVSSYTSISVNSASVKDTTTNDKTVVSSNRYVTLVLEEAIKYRPSLKGQQVICFSEDAFKNSVQVTFLVSVNKRIVLVSGFVFTDSNKVEIASLPDQIETGLVQSEYSSCSERSTTITTLTSQSVTVLSQTKIEYQKLVSFMSSSFSLTTKDIISVIVERFPHSIKFVVVVRTKTTTQRVVLLYQIRTLSFTVIEKPEGITVGQVVVLEQRTESDGTKVVTSNTVEQIKTVDQKIEKFIEVLSKQVQVEQSQITNVVSRQSTNTNEYTLVVKGEKTTSEIKAVFKKDDETVIVTEVKEQPKPIIAPLIKPKITVSKQEYSSTSITKVVEQINSNKKIPNITTEKIVEIVKTSTPVTTSYEITTETVQGKQTFTVTENIKGELTVIDYKPAVIQQVVDQHIKTEYVVNSVSGYETQVTNDVKVIKESSTIQNVVSKLVQEQTVTKNVEVVSAVTKTLEDKVQTTIVTRSPERPKENIVVVAVFDKKTEQVTIIGEKTVQVKDVTEQVTVEEEVVQTVYTTTVIEKTMKKDKTIQNIVNKVSEINKEVVNVIPSQIITEKIGEKILSTITYEDKKIVSTVVYDERTEQATVISTQSVPQEIKPLVYETETFQGQTTVVTNSVEKVLEINQNFNKVISEIKQSIPSIQTEKIEGIKIVKSDIQDAPQKIVILFQSQKSTEQTQIAVIDEPNKPNPIIVDVQTILKEQIKVVPEPVKLVKLTTEEIREQKVETIITSNIKQLPITQVKSVVDVYEVKTAYSTVLDVKVTNEKGQTYIIKTEQFVNEEPKIIDYVKVPEVKKPEIFTITSTNPKNGIVSTYTNDIKVMSEEKTFNKLIDSLEKQRSLTKNGYTIDSETVSRLQRSVEHHIRFVNKQTNEGIDYRVLVDSRTGQITINEEEKVTLIVDAPSTMPAEKSYLEIPKSQLTEAMKRYTFIQSSLDVLRKADYTFEGKMPQLTQIKQYKGLTTSTSSTSTTSNAVEVVMTFQMSTSGSVRKNTRVVFIGEQKQPGRGFIMKIIDITTLPQVISSTETQIVYDEFNRKIITTNDIKTMEKTSAEYVKVVDTIKEEISSLSTAEVSSVVVKEFKNANEYTMMIKKGTQVIQTRVTFDKTTQQAVISDFKTQSTKSQVQRVPIKQIQSIVTEVTQQKLVSAEFIAIKQQISELSTFSSHNIEFKSVTVEQNPRVDTFVMKVVDERNVESTITAIKNPTTQQITVISVKEDKTTHVQQVRTKESTTEVKIDSVTGSQITTTNDVKVIRETASIQNIMQKAIQQKTVTKQSQVVSAVTKTSENTIQSTIIVRDVAKPTTQTVIVAMSQTNDTTKVEIISQEIIEITEEVEETVIEKVVREVVITKKTYSNVIKRDTHLQTVVKAVETKYTEVKNQIPTQVVIQEVGSKTISEITYDTKKVTVVTNENHQVIKTYEETIPAVIQSGTIETTTSIQGQMTITTNNVELLTKTDTQFKQVVSEVTKSIQKQSIQTVVSQQTSFGKVYTVISQTTQQLQPTQTIYFYNKETKQVTNMGTEQISVISSVHQQVTENKQETVKQVSESKWTTDVQVKSVIQEVTNVVKQDKVTKVEEIKSAATVVIYQVTVETEKGTEVVKVTVDKNTKEVQVIDKKTEVVTQQVTQSSQTTVTVNQYTGVKTTSTTDISVIKVDKIVQSVHQTAITQNTELKNSEIVSVVTKQYDQKVQERVILKKEDKLTQIVAVVDKKTDKVTIIEKSTVDTVKQVVSDVMISSTMIEEVISRDDVMRRMIQFVGSRLPLFGSIKPANVNVDQLTSTITYTTVYLVSSINHRIVVSYNKVTRIFQLLQQPTEVQPTKPIMFETTVTETGRTNYFTNDVETLTKYDSNFNTVFSQVTKDVKISTSDISSVQTTQTSTGTSYTIMSTKGTEQNQMSVVYNEKTKEVKIVDLETVKEPMLIQPAPRPLIAVSKEEYTSDDIVLITDRSVSELKISKFTYTQITKVEKSKTSVGTTYTLQVDTDFGKSYIVASVSSDRTVTIISYKAPVTTKPMLIAQAPSTTQFSVDSVTGTQIQTTNDVKVIRESSTVQNVMKQLVKSSVVTKESEVVSSTTKTTADTIHTTMLVKSENTNKVVITSTDKKTNEVKVLAERQVTHEEVKKVTQQQVEITQIVPQTVISSTIYEEVVKKDVTLQNVIKEVRSNHPQIKETVPTKVVVEKVGEKTVTEVSYKDSSYTVVSDVKTGVTEEVVTSTLFKETERKQIVLQQRITEQGTKIVTSNKLQQIEKIVPTVRPAITEIIKLMPTIKTEQIKSITSSVEQKQFTVITVDQTNKVQQVTFTYEPEKPMPIKLIDVQEFSEPMVIAKPKEIVYEKLVIQEESQVVKAIEKVNKTSSIIKNDVTEILKIEKAVTNMVEEYKVQVKTHTEEKATIVLQMNQQTKQMSVVDVVKYTPTTEQPKVIVVQQTIDSVTQTRQTVFPTVETYKQDETYKKVTEYLSTQITKGYTIESVVKQNYGENKQVSILLKSEDKSPQQIQLNINSFNNEVTVLQNKTIVSSETQEFELLSKEQPKPVELKLNPVDQEKFEIISKLNVVKQEEGFTTMTEVKTLEKNELFKKADTYLKTQFESILQQSNIVHVATKQTLDSEQYKVYYVNTENTDKEVYEAKVKINPITQTFEVSDFSKVGSTKPEKSNLNVGADIAYGYQPLNDFSNNNNIKFIVTEAKKHYTTLANAVIQSVEVLSLCNGRFNYKIYFKNGLEVIKYIIYFEETFKRIIYLEGKEFSFGGSFTAVDKNTLQSEGYFKNVNQYIKERNSQIAEGSQIVHVEREDRGREFAYRVIYMKDGKTYHAASTIDKDILTVNTQYFNQVIEIPVVQQVVSPASSEKYATLRINDLAHNSNFEKVHREILSKEGGFLQNAQLVGAQQQSDMFRVWYKFYFLSKQDYYKIEAEIDSTNKKVTILTDLEKVNTEAGFSPETNSQIAQDNINWAQKVNPDLKSGVVMEVSSKNEIFGQMYKLVIKMQTKYYKVVVYREGNDMKVLSQGEFTSMDSSPSVRSFPRPGRIEGMTLNNA